ncbi:hypothetical protein QNI16_36565 [Cytophagaceae bacterium YF14B1]|uniref:Uncharacterized protein n=1 Tax=Xanthocytophaga flava TaxID=3048013 RepID=A0AAE3R0X0_9BACT|nr:hypothetical protein [Xanthocytophaga flavus]MDJ1486053.1 hypothetical protein [Xanthocytophaga flavus]
MIHTTNKGILLGICLFLCIIYTSCKHQLSSSEFAAYIEQKEELRKVSSSQGIQMQCQYFPAAYMALLDFRSVPSEQLREADFSKSYNQYKDNLYFKLSFESEEGKDITRSTSDNAQSYQQRMYDMNYYFDRHIMLVTDTQDTLRPAIFTLQKSFTASPKVSFLLGFAKTPALQSANEIDLIYRDAYFNLPRSVHFVFTNTEINQNLPTITFTDL